MRQKLWFEGKDLMSFNNIWNWFCKLCMIALILLLINSILGDILFRIKYSFPKSSGTTNEKITTANEPVQINLKQEKYVRAYGEKEIYALKLQAQYSLSGLVVSKNTNFWLRDVMRNDFDDICLMDIGIVWGDLAIDKKALYKHLKFKSTKTLGQARQLQVRCKKNCTGMPWSIDYVDTHLSHTHLIPANPNIMGGLLRIKKNDIVKLDGYLVDIYTDKSETVALTSMSRYDRNTTSRGYGACEDMYVKQVQIGNKIYK